MARTSRMPRAELTDSWTEVHSNEGSTEEFTSEEEPSPPRTGLGAAQRQERRDDLASSRNQQTSDSKLISSRSNLDRQVPNSTKPPGPRQRVSQSGRLPERATFVMPTIGDKQIHSLRSSTPAISSARSQPVPRNRARPAPASARKSQASRSDETSSSSAFERAAQSALHDFLVPTIGYAFSIARLAAVYAKPFIAYALAIYVLVGLLIMARNMLTSSMTSALAPICLIPGTGFLNLPFCVPKNTTSQTGTVQFDELISAQAAFEDVLTASAGGSSLPLEMKRSEGSIRDLRQVVQYSTLPSRNELVFEFTGFIDTARQASSDLSKYNTRIGSAVDRILSTNRWTLQVLDGIAATSASQSSLSSYLDIFAPFRASTVLTQDVLFDQYIRHTSAIEEQIQTLILEGQALLSILQNLDERLDLIAGIATRDGIKASGEKDELFAYIWTKLGGNRSSVQKINNQLAVLNDLGNYRRLAWAHVTGTTVKLQEIAHNLEDLRERVARPETVGIRKDLPLEMHVQEIVMGVERLEAVRNEGRRIEDDRVRGILDRGERMQLEAK